MVTFLFISKIPIFWDFFIPIFAENKRWFGFPQRTTPKRKEKHHAQNTDIRRHHWHYFHNSKRTCRSKMCQSVTRCNNLWWKHKCHPVAQTGWQHVPQTVPASIYAVYPHAQIQPPAPANHQLATQHHHLTSSPTPAIHYAIAKMVSPAVSRWIYLATMSNCPTTCAKMCANFAGNPDRAAIIKSMFTSMSD